MNPALSAAPLGALLSQIYATTLRSAKATMTWAAWSSVRGWRKSPPRGNSATFQRQLRWGIWAGSTSTLRSSAKDDFTLFKCRQGPAASAQTETSGLPWVTLICQFEGNLPAVQLAVSKAIRATWEVCAQKLKASTVQTNRVFKNPLKGGCAVIILNIA